MSDLDDNRIRVKFQPELTPVRLQDRMDVKAEIDVGVDTHLKGVGVAGAVAAGTGLLAILVALTMLAFGYPYPDLSFVKSVVLLAAAGVILLFLGASAFFYGRTVLGSGHLDEFSTTDVPVASPEEAS